VVAEDMAIISEGVKVGSDGPELIFSRKSFFKNR
jgi:hypothetical protein